MRGVVVKLRGLFICSKSILGYQFISILFWFVSLIYFLEDK